MPNIVLVGLMGAGKTTVARILAERTGHEMVDTDLVIEERAGRSIPEIFATDGEAGFRRVAQATGPSRGPANGRGHKLEVNGGVAGEQLRMTFTYDRELHDEATLQRLVTRFTARLEQLVEVCLQGASARLDASAADFGWSEDDVDDLLAEIE